MPTLQVSRARLFNMLRVSPATGKICEKIKLPDGLWPISADNGQTTDKKFGLLCFRFGVELDEVTTLAKILEKEKGAKGKAEAGKEADEILYKIDLPANRYDLMSLEGFATALQVFLKSIPIPSFTLVPAANPITMRVKQSIKSVRPFVVCAVLRDVQWDAEGHGYNSFIDLQEKLHGNLCRKRTVASVGTHDLQTILKDADNTPTFTYEAVAPEDFSFVPLSTTEEVTGAKLINDLKEGTSLKHLSKFVHLVDNIPAVPLIRDHKGRVLSLPPIINSEFSKISINTKDIFIECTATDAYKAEVVVNQIVANFSRYCSKPFTVEPVSVVYETEEGEKSTITPNVALRDVECSVERMQRGIGVKISGDEMVEFLTTMMIESSVSGDRLVASAPINRSDVLHACDIMEDVAIAFGYDQIPKEPVPTVSLGTQQSLNHLQHLVRCELAMAGYREVLPFSLCSEKEGYEMLNLTKTDMEREAVRIANPQTQEFQICRTSLLPGLLKTLQMNIAQPIPIKMFEVQDVVLKENSGKGVGAKNERRVAALYCSDKGSLEVIHGVVDLVLLKLDAEKRVEYKGVDHPTYFPGQHGDILLDGKSVGGFGVLHPEVTHNHWGLPYPVAYMEFNLEPFDNLDAPVDANQIKNVVQEHEPKELA